MVATDDFNQFWRQMPATGDELAALAMGYSEHRFFGLMQGGAFRARPLERTAEIVWGCPKKGHNANIVQEPGGIGFCGIGKPDSSGELSGHHGACERVGPEHGWTSAEGNRGQQS